MSFNQSIIMTDRVAKRLANGFKNAKKTFCKSI